MLAGGVEINTHKIYAAFYYLVQSCLEPVLVDVVLVLADSDTLGVNFYKFAEGIQQPATDTDGAANGNIFIRELFPGCFAGRIDRGATFIYHKNRNRSAKINAPHQLFCFFAGGPISVADGIDIKLGH